MSSIFLSHSHADKSFVNKLARDLRRPGYFVWTDDAEIKIGDSLIQKIREGIDKVAYVGAVISHSSIDSEWVKKELDIAMNQEIEGRKVKVLPLLLDDVELPNFLKGKRYADFRDNRRYKKSLNEIKKRLDDVPSKELSYTPKEAEYLAKKLKKLEKQLKVAQSEKELLLDKLSGERKVVDPAISKAIDEDKKWHPELEDVNRNFAFLCGGVAVTAGYILHVIEEQRIKGIPHQVVFLAGLEGKMVELSILASATMRRLHRLSSSEGKKRAKHVG